MLAAPHVLLASRPLLALLPLRSLLAARFVRTSAFVVVPFVGMIVVLECFAPSRPIRDRIGSFPFLVGFEGSDLGRGRLDRGLRRSRIGFPFIGWNRHIHSPPCVVLGKTKPTSGKSHAAQRVSEVCRSGRGIVLSERTFERPKSRVRSGRAFFFFRRAPAGHVNCKLFAGDAHGRAFPFFDHRDAAASGTDWVSSPRIASDSG